MSSKPDNIVASLIMKHHYKVGCNTPRFPNWMGKKELHHPKPSDLKISIPIVKMNSSKRSTPLRRPRESSDDEVSDLLNSTRFFIPKPSKPRLSDAFLTIPVENKSFDPTKSGRFTFNRLSRPDKPRLSDAFLRRMHEDPSFRIHDESSFDADDESSDDLLRSRRVLTRKVHDPFQKPVDSSLISEDDELTSGMTEIEPISSRLFSISGRWEIKDGHIYITNDRPIFSHAPHAIKRDPTAKVIHYSSTEDVLYKDDCMCNFCRLLREYNGCIFLFSRHFNTGMGHGFFSRM